MSHYILYFHAGSTNHGCEALVRTISELLDYKNNKITLMSFGVGQDRQYGIDKICDIHHMHEKKKVKKKSFKWIKAFLKAKITGKQHYLEDLPRINAIDAKKGDVAISIGGDNYCYDLTDQLAEINAFWKRNGIKTVLWGCSIEPEVLKNNAIAKDIESFDLIAARETISYNAIKALNNNTVLVSDPAFNLNTIRTSLPNDFSDCDLVGLNLSPMAEECETKKGIARRNYEKLIEYILQETSMKILLIPHVVSPINDDRTINKYLYDKYKESGRIFMIEDCGCQELKGYISQCRFFVGARTHSTIAAYSSLVPTLVLGYSVKSIGIARDLFDNEEKYVIPVQSLTEENDLLLAFKWMQTNENDIKAHLTRVMPAYKEKAFNGIELIKSL